MLGARCALGLVSVSTWAVASATCADKLDDDRAECASGSTAHLTVDVSGLVGGATPAKVTVVGPDGSHQLVGTETFSEAPTGSYEIHAESLTLPRGLTTALAIPTIDDASFCLVDGENRTVEVAYQGVRTSGSLWVTHDAGIGALVGFDEPELEGVSGAGSAVFTGEIGEDLAFDREGNIWTFWATADDLRIQRFPANQFSGMGGAAQADISLRISTPSCSPMVSQIAFDPRGNLWVSSPCAGSVSEITADCLTASGDVEPAVVMGGFTAPSSIAFDPMGNLWIADAGARRIDRIDASRLSTSTDGAADLGLTPKVADGASDIYAPAFLAFDTEGNLWSNDVSRSSMFRLDVADLATTGSVTTVPTVEIEVAFQPLLGGMAFDDEGGLWTPLGETTLGRFAPEQLTASSAPRDPSSPQQVLSRGELGNVRRMAFFPAAPGLPLFHSFD